MINNRKNRSLKGADVARWSIYWANGIRIGLITCANDFVISIVFEYGSVIFRIYLDWYYEKNSVFMTFELFKIVYRKNILLQKKNIYWHL